MGLQGVSWSIAYPLSIHSAYGVPWSLDGVSIEFPEASIDILSCFIEFPIAWSLNGTERKLQATSMKVHRTFMEVHGNSNSTPWNTMEYRWNVHGTSGHFMDFQIGCMEFPLRSIFHEVPWKFPGRFMAFQYSSMKFSETSFISYSIWNLNKGYMHFP